MNRASIATPKPKNQAPPPASREGRSSSATSLLTETSIGEVTAGSVFGGTALTGPSLAGGGLVAGASVNPSAATSTLTPAPSLQRNLAILSQTPDRTARQALLRSINDKYGYKFAAQVAGRYRSQQEKSIPLVQRSNSSPQEDRQCSGPGKCECSSCAASAAKSGNEPETNTLNRVMAPGKLRPRKKPAISHQKPRPVARAVRPAARPPARVGPGAAVARRSRLQRLRKTAAPAPRSNPGQRQVTPGQNTAVAEPTGPESAEYSGLGTQFSLPVPGSVARSVLVQREPAVADCPPPAVDKPAKSPQSDPDFQALKGRSQTVATEVKKTEPAKEKASAAQEAAQPPANDTNSQAAAAQVDTMSQQQPGTFDKEGFKRAVKQAIENNAPQTMEEADNYNSSGKAGNIKDSVSKTVGDNKEQAQKGIKEKTQEPPDPSKAKPKQVTPMKPEEAGPPPPDLNAGQAMPDPKTPEETNLQHEHCEVDKQMAEADVTEEQLRNSNEPDFVAAADSKKQGEDYAKTAPQQFQSQEKSILGDAKDQAGATSDNTLAALHNDRTTALTQATTQQDKTKTSDEDTRTKTANDIEQIYNDTKTDVENKLNSLDGTVNSMFDSGESDARKQMEDTIKHDMDDYKEKNYSGPIGWGRWVADKLIFHPKELDNIVDRGRQLYLNAMDTVIDKIAGTVSTTLTEATARIADGRKKIQDYVDKLPADLKEVGQEAQEQIQDKFDQLSQEVADKQDSLVDKLAEKYQQSLQSVDDELNKMKEENKSLGEKAADAVKGAIDTISKLKDQLGALLQQAGDVLQKIMKDPMAFAGNLISALNQGIGKFLDGIDKKLISGLVKWLTGAAGNDAPLKLPGSFDLPGLFSLLLQILGFTYENFRARFVKAFGKKAVEMAEKISPIFQMIAGGDLAGLWQHFQEVLQEQKDQFLQQAQQMVMDQVVQAGIQFLLGMLGGPIGAFIKACETVISVISFIMDNASELMEFISTIIKSIGDVADGNVGAAADGVNTALTSAIPMVLNLLAKLLHLDTIPRKVAGLLKKARGPLNTAIDKLLRPIAKSFKKVVTKVKNSKAAKKAKKVAGKVGQLKEGFDNLPAWANKQGRKLNKKLFKKLKGTKLGKKFSKFYKNAKNKYNKLKNKITGKDRSPEKKQQDLNNGVNAAVKAVNALPGLVATEQIIRPILMPIKVSYRLSLLKPVKQGKVWAIEGDIARSEKKNTHVKVKGKGNPKDKKDIINITKAHFPHRPKFRVNVDKDLMKLYPDCYLNGKLKPGLVRRHIVAWGDLVENVVTSLNGINFASGLAKLKTVENADKYLKYVQKKPLNKHFVSACKNLLYDFNSDSSNLWPGNLNANSSIGQDLDAPKRKEWVNLTEGLKKQLKSKNKNIKKITKDTKGIRNGKIQISNDGVKGWYKIKLQKHQEEMIKKYFIK